MKESDQMDQEHLTNLLESPLCEKSNEEWCDVSKSTIAELKKQVHLAGPLVVVSLLQYSLQMISVMFIGHLGELSLSSASMATSFAGVTGFSLMVRLLLVFAFSFFYPYG